MHGGGMTKAQFATSIGHDIIQRQITQKRYKIELYLRTNRQSCDLSNGAIFNDFERTLPRFQNHAIFDAEA